MANHLEQASECELKFGQHNTSLQLNLLSQINCQKQIHSHGNFKYWKVGACSII